MITFFALMGVMSAMNEEASTLLSHMENKQEVRIGSRSFTKGKLEEMDVVFALSGIGKVAAATTATLMISHFDVEGIVFTGVAGGGSESQIGDVVIGHSYVQHDFDTRPIFPLCYIHNLQKQILSADERLYEVAKQAAETYLSQGIQFPELGIFSSQVREGCIVSGDQFIINTAQHQAIVDRTKEIIPNGFHAIEMEGAAVAQVCGELQVPFVVLRAISDRADHGAPTDFLAFIQQVASAYSLGILTEFAKIWNNHLIAHGNGE